MSYNWSNTIYQEEVYSVGPKPVVVLSKPWTYTSDSEKILLEKILGLAHSSIGNVKIITSEKLDILQWVERPPVVIAFGLDLPGLSKNEILDVHEVKLVITSDLVSLETTGKETKQKLAHAIKSLFA